MRALVIVSLMVVTGCVELSGEEPYSTLGGGGPSGTFESAQAVFDQSCALGGCHGGARPTNPPLAADQSFGAIVGEQGISLCNGELLVDPGNPDGSCLLGLVETGQMPPGGGLAQGQIDALRSWIAAGAPGPAGATGG